MCGIWCYVFLNLVVGYVGTDTADTTQGYSYTSNPLTLTTTVSRRSPGNNGTTALPANITQFSITQETETSTIDDTQIQQDLSCAGRCDNLSASCYDCNTSNNCTYGKDVLFQCTVKSGYQCIGNRSVTKVFKCVYCFLMTENVDYTCNLNNTSCSVNAAPPQRFNSTCTAKPTVFCLGKRTFVKLSLCNWTAGYKWSTALALSITLGGFGADRFYLGYWKEALGKLFSFGGLGVWTLIDIVLIGTSYLMPADGSLYIY